MITKAMSSTAFRKAFNFDSIIVWCGKKLQKLGFSVNRERYHDGSGAFNQASELDLGKLVNKLLAFRREDRSTWSDIACLDLDV